MSLSINDVLIESEVGHEVVSRVTGLLCLGLGLPVPFVSS